MGSLGIGWIMKRAEQNNQIRLSINAIYSVGKEVGGLVEKTRKKTPCCWDVLGK